MTEDPREIKLSKLSKIEIDELIGLNPSPSDILLQNNPTPSKKDSPDYQRGKEVGLKADVPNLMTFERASYLAGYAEGLEELLSQNAVSVPTNVNVAELLASAHGLIAYIDGLKAATGDKQKDEDKNRFKYLLSTKSLNQVLPKHEFKKEIIPKHEFNQEIIPKKEFDHYSLEFNPMYARETRSAYQLGFVAGMIKQHKIGFAIADAPGNDLEARVFMQGFNAMPREMENVFIPLTIERIEIKKDYGSYPNSNAASSERLYMKGLELWLARSGIPTTIATASQIRNPEALKAFKDALEGTDRTDLTKRDERILSFIDEHYPEDQFKIPLDTIYEKTLDKLPKVGEPSYILETQEQAARHGYALGVKAKAYLDSLPK